MRHLRQQQGFTMIELIMVIVILGVLSAFALPKFADLGGSARTAAVEGVAGSLRSAVGISRAAYLAAGGTGTSVALDGVTISLDNGYPDGGVTGPLVAGDGIALAAGLIEPDSSTANGADADLTNDDQATYTNGDFTIAATATTMTVTLQANCLVTYTDATATTIPSIVVDTSGCP